MGGEKANVYFDEAMIDKPEAAWEALLKEVLKGDSKKVWHGVVLNNGLDQILRANVFLPEVDATREYWNPTIEEQAALNVIEDGRSCTHPAL